jgi:hypothetical protein
LATNSSILACQRKRGGYLPTKIISEPARSGKSMRSKFTRATDGADFHGKKIRENPFDPRHPCSKLLL